MNGPGSVETATALAGALDREDYPAARALLDDNCVYEIRGEEIVGADAIVASYRENGEAGRKRFDEVRYESAVSELAPTRARIDYTDIVTLGNSTHVHCCAQEIETGADGRVVNIAHIDLPGQREMLEAFKADHPAP